MFLLVPAYLGCTGPKAVKRLSVCVCVCVCVCVRVRVRVCCLQVTPENKVNKTRSTAIYLMVVTCVNCCAIYLAQ